MIISNLLGAVGLALSVGSATLSPQRQTYQDVDVSVTYQYETNEVNSPSDLVEGNIYKLNETIGINGLNPHIFDEQYDSYFLCNLIVKDLFNVSELNIIETVSEDSNVWPNLTTLSINSDNIYITCQDYISCSYELGTLYWSNCYIVYLESQNLANVSFLEESDYLGQETTTITEIETSGLFNIFYDFLNSRIFTGGFLDSLSTEIFGTTLTLGNWLSILTAIVCLALVIVVFVKLVIFLFKIVGNLFLLR